MAASHNATSPATNTLARDRTAIALGSADAGAVASIGTVGDSFENAMAESVIALYKTECVRHERPWRGVDDLELATFNWVWWFNQTRLHGEIGYVPSIEFENNYYRQINPNRTRNWETQPPLQPGRFSLVG